MAPKMCASVVATMGMGVVVAMLFTFVVAVHPSPLQDFCVSDPTIKGIYILCILYLLRSIVCVYMCIMHMMYNY